MARDLKKRKYLFYGNLLSNPRSEGNACKKSYIGVDSSVECWLNDFQK